MFANKKLKKTIVNILLVLFFFTTLAFSSHAMTEIVTWSIVWDPNPNAYREFEIIKSPDIWSSGTEVRYKISISENWASAWFNALFWISFWSIWDFFINSVSGNAGSSNYNYYLSLDSTINPWETKYIEFTWTINSWSFEKIVPFLDLEISWNSETLNFKSEPHVIYPLVQVGLDKNIIWLLPSSSWDSVFYEFLVSNSWASFASGLVLNDEFPDELLFSWVVSSEVPVWNSITSISCVWSPISCNLPTIPQNSTWRFVLEFILSWNYDVWYSISNTWTLNNSINQTWLEIINKNNFGSWIDIENIQVAGLADLFVNISTNTPQVHEKDDIVSYDIQIWNSWTSTVSGTIFSFQFSGINIYEQNIPTLYGQTWVILWNTIVWYNLDIWTWSINDQNIVITWTLSENFIQNTTLNSTWIIIMPLGFEDREIITIDNTSTNNMDSDNQIIILGRPDLGITKILENPDDIDWISGDVMIYKLEFGNYGTNTSTGVVIFDNYNTANFEYWEWFEFWWQCNWTDIDIDFVSNNNWSIIWNISDLEPWCTGFVRYTGNLIKWFFDGEHITNSWGINWNPSQELNWNTNSNQSVSDFVINGYVELNLQKIISGVYYITDPTNPCIWSSCEIYGSGDMVEYTITLTNNGNMTSNINFEDDFSPSDRFIQKEIIPNSSVNIQAWESISFLVRAIIQWNESWDFINTATVTDNTNNISETIDTPWQILGRAVLDVEKSFTSIDLATNEIVFEFKVSNNWYIPASFDVIDNIPSLNINIDSVLPSSIVDLNPWEYITWQIIWTVIDNTPWIFQNTISLTNIINPNSVILNYDNADVEFEIPIQRILDINKELVSVEYLDNNGWICYFATEDCPIYGSWDRLDFTITISNSWNSMITWLEVRDNFPIEMTFENADNGGYLHSSSNREVRWTWLTLNTWYDELVLNFSTVLNTDNILENQINNTNIDISDTNRGSDDIFFKQSDDVSFDRLGRSYLSIEKTVIWNDISEWPYYPGDEVYFQITITNSWTKVATWITFNDNFPESINIPNLPISDISVPARVGDTNWTYSFIITGTVVWDKWEYLGIFTNTWSILDTNPNWIRQWTTITKNVDSEDFHIRPKTELNITKEYCGMNGDCVNPQDPYWNRYGERQKVWFRLTLHNSGNIDANDIDVSDFLPSVLSGFGTLSDGWTWTTSRTGQWTDLTINTGSDIVIYITWQLNTENIWEFTNIARYDEVDQCTSTNNIMTSAGSGCQDIIVTSDTANWQILGMARIDINKSTLDTNICRIDPRQWEWTYPIPSNIWSDWCLVWPALSGDELGFRITLTNSGTRAGSGLRLQDLITKVSQYPDNSETNIMDLTGIVRVCDSNNTNCQSVSTSESDLFILSESSNFGNIIVPPMANGQNGQINVYFTWVLRFATGYDVNRNQINTGIVSDPSAQSGVVIVWWTSGNRSAFDTSNRLIPEYMQANIVKTINSQTNPAGLLSWDDVYYDINFRNVWNTGFYFTVYDIWNENYLDFESWISNANNNDTNFSVPSNCKESNSSNTNINCNPWNNIAWWQSANWDISRHNPMRFLTPNGFGSIIWLNWKVINNFDVLWNTARIVINDQNRSEWWIIKESIVDISGRAIVEFSKVLLPWMTNPTDPFEFVLTITNTWNMPIIQSFVVQDQVPWCLTVSEWIAQNWQTYTTTNTNNNLQWTLNNITIPAKSGFIISLKWNINQNPLNTCDEWYFVNTACLWTWNSATWNDWNEVACASDTGYLWLWLFDLQKEILTWREVRFTGDDVVYRITITNNSNSSSSVTFNDIRPNNNFIQYVSNSENLPLVNGAYSGTFNIPWYSPTNPDQNKKVIYFTGMVSDNAIPQYLWQIFTNTWRLYYNGRRDSDVIATGKLLTWIYVSKEVVWPDYGISGSQVGFRLRFWNYTTWDLDYVYIRDYLPDGLDGISFVSSDVYPYNIADLGNGDFDPEWFEQPMNTPRNIAPGVITDIVLTWKIFSDSNGFTSLFNNANFQFFENSNITSMYFNSSANATIYPISDLDIVKKFVWNIPQNTNDPVQYEIIVTNRWTFTATWIKIVDLRPQWELPQQGTTYVVYKNGVVQSNPNPINQWWSLLRSGQTWLSDLQPWQNIRIVINTNLSTYNQWVDFCNPANVTTTSREWTWNIYDINNNVIYTNWYPNSYEACISPMWVPDLWITKTTWTITTFEDGVATVVNRPEISGDTIEYVINYGNSGNQTISGWTINGTTIYTWWTLTDTYPSQLTFDGIVSNPWNLVLVSTSNNKLVFTGGDLWRDGSDDNNITIRFRLNANYNPNTCFINTWNINLVEDSYLERNFTNNSFISANLCVLWRPDLVITKEILTWSSASSIGSPVSYRLTVSNTGNTVASGFTVSDILPTQLTGYVFSRIWTRWTDNLMTWTGWQLWLTNWVLNPNQSVNFIITWYLVNDLLSDWTNVFCNTWIIELTNPPREFTLKNNTWWNACVTPGWWFFVDKLPDVQYGVSGWLVNFQFTYFNNTADTVCVWFGDKLKNYGFEYHSSNDWVDYIINNDGISYQRENVWSFQSNSVNINAIVTPNNYNFGTLTNYADFRFVRYKNWSCDRWDVLWEIRADAKVLAIPDVVVEKIYTSAYNPQLSGDETNYRLRFTNIWWVQATGFDVCDYLPTNITVSSTSPNLWAIPSCDKWMIVSSLNPWASLDITINWKLNDNYPINTQFCNTGQVFTKPNRFTGDYDTWRFNGRTNPHIDTVCNIVEWIPDIWSEKIFSLADWSLANTGDRPRISGDSVFYTINYWNTWTQNISWRQFTGENNQTVLFSWRTITDSFPSNFLNFSWIVMQEWQNIEIFDILTWNWTLTLYGSGILLADNLNEWEITLEFVIKDNFISYLNNSSNCRYNTWTANMPNWLSIRERWKTTNNADSSEKVCILGWADLWINKEILTWQYPNMSWDLVVYRITYWNSGTVTLTWRSITDELPNYLTWYSISPSWIIDWQVVNRTWWQLGFINWLNPWNSGQIIITWKLLQNYTQWEMFCNTWMIMTLGELWDTSDDRFTWNNINQQPVCSIVGWAVDLVLEKSYSGNVAMPWDTMSFMLDYYNTWTKTATGPITVIDYLPSFFDFITWSTILTVNGTNWTLISGYPTVINTATWKQVRWEINTDIIQGWSGRIEFDVKLNTKLTWWTIIINTWQIEVFDPEPNTINNQSVVSFQNLYVPDVWINKTILSWWRWIYWSEFSFALNFGNNWILGSGDATGVYIADILPFSWFNFNNPTQCSIELANIQNIVWNDTLTIHTTYPWNWSCSYLEDDNGFGIIYVTGLDISGWVRGRVVITWYLDFQPVSEFCYTNTWNINYGYLTWDINSDWISDFINRDFYTWNNSSSINDCIEPELGVVVTKTAIPQRELPIDPSLWLDISGALVGFNINILNTGEVAISWISLRDLINPNNLWRIWDLYWPWLWSLPNTNGTNNILDEQFDLLPWSWIDFQLTWHLTNRNFWTLTNTAIFNYNIAGILFTGQWSVTLQEPNQCGDRILSRMEQCEWLSWWRYLVSDLEAIDENWYLLSGLVCTDTCDLRLEKIYNLWELCVILDGQEYCITDDLDFDIPKWKPDLKIEKTAISGIQSPWNSVRYRVVITNSGNAEAINSSFTDTRPSQIELTTIQAPSGIVINTGDTSRTTIIPRIAVGESITLTFNWTVKSDANSDAINSACIQAIWQAKICDPATIIIWTTPPPQPIWAVTIDKNVVGTQSVYYSGQTVTFTISVNNTSTTQTWNITLTDIRPNSYISLWWIQINKEWINWNITNWRNFNLAPSSSVLFTMTGKVIVNGPVVAINTWNISYTFDGDTTPRTWQDTASVNIQPRPTWTCEIITPKYKIENLSDSVSSISVTYTCEASNDAVSTTQMKLYCDEWQSSPSKSVNGTGISHTCDYSSTWNYRPYCTANDSIWQCQADLTVQKPVLNWYCGDGIIQWIERCDLSWNNTEIKKIDSEWYLEDRNNPNQKNEDYASIDWVDYYCSSCDIIQDKEPVIVPPLCRYSDTTVSIQMWEFVPFRRDLKIDNTTDSCDDKSDSGKIVWMPKCNFKIYRKWKEVLGEYFTTLQDISCDAKVLSSEDEMIRTFLNNDNFWKYKVDSFNKALGNYKLETEDRDIDTMWEYKISLEEINYDYCEADWESVSVRPSTIKRICQVNFALTRPYFLQKWVSSNKSDSDLSDYYDMVWDRIVDNLNLDNMKSVNTSTFDWWDDLTDTIDILFEKYNKPSILIDINWNWKKVKGKNIIIADWDVEYSEWEKYNWIDIWAITILVDWDLTVKWGISTPTMFVVKWKIKFEQPDCERQTINWIVISQWWFDANYAEDEISRNNDLTKSRCRDGWLTIKWILVWPNIDDLVKVKRSNLNDRFGFDPNRWITLDQERTQEIYNWASVLVEYNPKLLLNLPPWANDIRKFIDTYRK